jgi:hypothetical protein
MYNRYMQSLQDIMGKKNFDEPPEIQSIKTFVRKLYSADVGVNIQTHSITITTPSASLAGSLRPHLYKLKEELDTDKKIFIRIG